MNSATDGGLNNAGTVCPGYAMQQHVTDMLSKAAHNKQSFRCGGCHVYVQVGQCRVGQTVAEVFAYVLK